MRESVHIQCGYMQRRADSAKEEDGCRDFKFYWWICTRPCFLFYKKPCVVSQAVNIKTVWDSCMFSPHSHRHHYNETSFLLVISKQYFHHAKRRSGQQTISNVKVQADLQTWRRIEPLTDQRLSSLEKIAKGCWTECVWPYCHVEYVLSESGKKSAFVVEIFLRVKPTNI